MPNLSGTALPWLDIGLGMLGGLALFIYSVTLLSQGLKTISGDKAKKILSKFTTSRYSGVLTGTAATVVIGSSSITIITVIAMVNAGLMSFVQSLGVVMGSNIGTTFSSQIFAFDAEKFAPVILIAGLMLNTLGKSSRWQNIGLITFALGLVFFSLGFIGDTMSPLRGYEPFRVMIRNLENPWFGVLIGAGLTALIQSSSAMMGIVIAMASQEMMTLEAGVAIMLGAEIGTCANTLIASIGRSRGALRTGLFHLLFNISTVIIGVTLAGEIVILTRRISGLADVERQIANAHLIFNAGGVMLFVLFTGLIARMLLWVIPAQPEKEKAADLEPTASPDKVLT